MQNRPVVTQTHNTPTPTHSRRQRDTRAQEWQLEHAQSLGGGTPNVPVHTHKCRHGISTTCRLPSRHTTHRYSSSMPWDDDVVVVAVAAGVPVPLRVSVGSHDAAAGAAAGAAVTAVFVTTARTDDTTGVTAAIAAARPGTGTGAADAIAAGRCVDTAPCSATAAAVRAVGGPGLATLAVPTLLPTDVDDGEARTAAAAGVPADDGPGTAALALALGTGGGRGGVGAAGLFFFLPEPGGVDTAEPALPDAAEASGAAPAPAPAPTPPGDARAGAKGALLADKTALPRAGDTGTTPAHGTSTIRIKRKGRTHNRNE